MLKFEGKFKKFDIVRSHDFKARPGVEPCYYEGVVVSENSLHRGAQVYVIACTRRVWCGQESMEEVGQNVFVPHQLAIGDWEDRVELVPPAHPTEPWRTELFHERTL